MKAHIGDNRDSGLVHVVTTTAANVADVAEMSKLLHGEATMVFGDAGYIGAQKRGEFKDVGVDWCIAERRHTIKALPEGELKNVSVWLALQAKVRARVEHPSRVIKRQFGYQQVRFKGLAKNTAQIQTLFALSNLWMARGRLLAATG